METILFVIAMEKEKALIEKAIFQLQAKDPSTNILVTGVGKVTSAISLTNYLMEHPEVGYVVNVGCAAALSQKFSYGDVILVDKFRQGDVYCGDPYKLGEVQGGVSEYSTDPDAFSLKGNCLTVDSFLSTSQSGGLISNFPDFDLVDMEGFGLVAAARNFEVNFYSIKVVSDYIYPTNHKNSYKKFWEDSDLHLRVNDKVLNFVL